MTKEEFEEKVSSLDGEFEFKGNKPVLIKFGTSWCAPCKRIAPIMTELASEFSGVVDVYSIDVEEVPEVAAKFEIQSVPSILYVDTEGKPTMKSGAYPKTEFLADFKNILGV